ncbi:MAG: winged helix DNA-binding protein [Thaumarchaeota archaeon]|nr:winged helix DNA-binding protein [Nitrososphaerota archaeon]
MIEELVIVAVILSVASIVLSLKVMSDLKKVGGSEERLRASLEREFLEVDRRISDLMRMCMDHDVRLGIMESKGVEKGVAKSEVEATSLNETEIRILKLLKGGEMTAKMVIKSLGKSREHTSRMLKGLYDKGLVTRDEGRRPYRYRLTEAGLEALKALP